MKSLVRLSLVVLMLMGLSACPSTQVAKLDGDFVDLYQTKIKYQTANDEFLLFPDGIYEGFAQLSKQAAQEAEKLKDNKEDAQTKVSYYRISTLASWQAGEADEANTLAVAEKGKAACENLKKYGLSSPRDCLFIELAVALAIQDNEIRELDKLLEPHVQDGTEPRVLPGSLLEPLKSITGNLLIQFKTVQDVRDEKQAVPVDPRFWKALDKQQLIIYCNAAAARVELVKVEGDGATEAAKFYGRQECTSGGRYFCQSEIEEMNDLFTGSSCVNLQQYTFRSTGAT